MTTAEKTMREAFIEAYSEMPDPVKNSDNPAFKRDGKPMRYADLEAFLDVAKPILVASGFALVQEPVSDGDHIGVHTRLLHKSGEEMDFGAFTMPLEGLNPQKAAGAITYARRYAVASIFGLAQADDDGNAASAPASSPAPRSAPQGAPAPNASPVAAKAVEANFRAMGAACKENGTRSAVEKAWKAMGVSVAHQTRDGFAALEPEQRATLEAIAHEKPATDEAPEYSDTDIPF